MKSVVGMVGLAAVAAYLEIAGHSAGWLWAGVVVLFLSI